LPSRLISLSEWEVTSGLDFAVPEGQLLNQMMAIAD